VPRARSSGSSMVAGVDIVAVVDSARNVRPGDVVTLHISLDATLKGSTSAIRSLLHR